MSIIIMLLLLSVLILVHEAGHFLAAKAFKIKVEKFGFGLPVGPVLFKTQWGDTTILIHALLLGGYVAFPDDEKDCELDADSDERFMNKPIYQRAIVVSAGVVANVICAFAFVFLTASVWGHMPSGKYDIYVNDFSTPKNISTVSSGMLKGDKIVEVNGEKITNTYSLLSFVKLSRMYDGKYSKNNAINNYIELKKINPVWEKDEIIPAGMAIEIPESNYESPAQINKKVLKGMAEYEEDQIELSAEQRKLRDAIKDKKVYMTNGKVSLKDISCAMADNARPLNIVVERDKKYVKLKPIVANEKGLIGIKLEAKEILIPTTTPIEVIKTGTKFLYDNTYAMVYGLGQIVSGKIPLQDLHGIVAITKVGGDVIANSGFFSGLLLIAIISMDLAIVNILPIPALDGGHLLFLLIEKIKGKPLNEKVVEVIGNTGFWFLIALMFLVIFNDIFGLITKKF